MITLGGSLFTSTPLTSSLAAFQRCFQPIERNGFSGAR